MSINVQQTLHGYRDGHQLLASSIPVDGPDHKLLLFQSDLSGPTLVNGFESYVSGFPLKTANYYAFSKTWYASEMERPGCVWTHTLLIEFPDIGKLSDLRPLKSLFKRPVVDNYEQYNRQLEILVKEPIRNENDLNDTRTKDQISTLLYENPDKSILIPASKSDTMEDTIIIIWNDQWPRLRRNFMFSSGSLALRSIDQRNYDLQVVPQKLIEQIRKQSEMSVVYSPDQKINPIISESRNLSPDLTNTLLKFIGSDVEGVRGNYLKLLQLINYLSKSQSIQEISSLLLKIFPTPSDALSFKKRLYGPSAVRPFNISESDLVAYLLTASDTSLSFLDLTSLNLDRRLVEMLGSKEITAFEFANLWHSSKEGRLSNNIWDSVSLSFEELISLSLQYPSLSEIFIQRDSEIGTLEKFWTLPIKNQRKAIKILSKNVGISDWTPFIKAIISANSGVILDLVEAVGARWLPNALELYSNSTIKDPTYVQPLLQEYYDDFRKWIRGTTKPIPSKLFEAIFIDLDYAKLQHLDLSSETWLWGYNSVTTKHSNVNEIFAASIVLSIGFQNRIKHADDLIIRTFETVYEFGKRSQLNSGIWQMINRDDYHYHEDLEPVGFWSLFTRKKKDRVPSWDYCESLIRIGSNSFVKNQWKPQSFLLAFRKNEIFERVVDYSLTYGKGERYMEWLANEVKSGKVKISRGQLDILKDLLH